MIVKILGVRAFLKSATLIAIAITGIIVVARSSAPESCPEGQICPAAPDCVSSAQARDHARAARRGPRADLVAFGFNDGSVLAGQASAGLVADLHRELGAGLIRFALDWRRVEPNPGTYDFGAEDQIYCAALERGVAPVIAIAGAPRWAAEPAGGCGNCMRPPKAEHLEALGELTRIIAERYPGAAAIEAWNEPNLPLFWEKPDPARYVEVLRAVREGVDRSGAKIPVLGGSLANVPDQPEAVERLRSFVAQIYERGGGSLMDAISIHPYPIYPADDPRQRFDPMVAIVREAAASHGHRRQPIWITELGLRTAGGADHTDVAPEDSAGVFSPAEQAESMAALYRKASSDPRIEAVLFHTLIEPDGRVASRGGFGWLAPSDEGIEAKPVWCAIHAIARPDSPCSLQIEAGLEDDGLR